MNRNSLINHILQKLENTGVPKKPDEKIGKLTDYQLGYMKGVMMAVNEIDQFKKGKQSAEGKGDGKPVGER